MTPVAVTQRSGFERILREINLGKFFFDDLSRFFAISFSVFYNEGAHMADFQDFANLDIRAGVIVKAELFARAKKPSYKVWVDFGDEIGIKTTSAQVTQIYRLEGLSFFKESRKYSILYKAILRLVCSEQKLL